MSKPVFSDLFSFSGRRDRKSYAFLLLAYCPILLGVIGIILVSVTTKEITGVVVGLVLFMLSTIPIMAASEQRLNDIGGPQIFGINLTGMLVFVPGVGWLFELLLVLIPGETGANQYGPDPLEPTSRNSN